jgi:quinoprotein glucose dehydrogenase
MLPGAIGGAAWESGAFDPETGFLYVSSSTIPSLLALVHDEEQSSLRYIQGRARARGPRDLPLVKPPYGRITAIDLRVGEIAWMRANGETPEAIASHPALVGVKLPRTGSPSRSGILVTKTLVLAGEGWGGGHGLYAYDKMTGDIIARIELPGAQTGLPMTYVHDGRQYVVMTTGDSDPRIPARIVALALPEAMR